MSETFWVFIVASSSALIGLLFKLSYDSKCTEIECCCIKIKRDVQTEERELGLKLQHIGNQFTHNPIPFENKINGSSVLQENY